MRHSSMVLGALASLAAPVAGVVAYQSWAPGPAHATDRPSVTTSSAGGATAPVVRYRRCARPARLEDGVCVTHRVRIVVAPAIAPLTLPGAGAPEAPVGSAAGATPAHPIHPPPTHEVDPVDDPAAEPTEGPAAEPTAPPSCDESEVGSESDQGDESERTAGGLFGRMAFLESGPAVMAPGTASDSDCAGADGDHGDDGDDGDDADDEAD